MAVQELQWAIDEFEPMQMQASLARALEEAYLSVMANTGSRTAHRQD